MPESSRAELPSLPAADEPTSKLRVLLGSPVDASMQPPALPSGLVERSRLLGQLSGSRRACRARRRSGRFRQDNGARAVGGGRRSPCRVAVVGRERQRPAGAARTSPGRTRRGGFRDHHRLRGDRHVGGGPPAGRAPEACGAAPRSAAVPSRLRRRPSPPCIHGFADPPFRRGTDACRLVRSARGTEYTGAADRALARKPSARRSPTR